MGYTFISGATGGLGKAFAYASAKNGYNLFLTARSSDRLNALKGEICEKYPKICVEVCPCELTDDDSRKNLIEFAKQKNLKFDRIINVAGVDIQKAFIDFSYEKVLFQTRVNCESTAFLTRALLDLREKNAEIIVISSMSGVSPMPYFAIYSASKAFLTSLFTALHYELKKQGVKVTSVLPGGIPTRPDIVKAIDEQGVWGKLSSKSPEFVAERSLKAVKKNKLIYVPGFFNKILYGLMKIIPKRLMLRFIAGRWSKLSKDAF